MFDLIPEKGTKTRTRFKFGVFMRLKEDKTYRPKNSKMCVWRASAMQMFKGSLIMDDKSGNTINSIHSSKYNFLLKVFKTGRRENESSSSVENIPMFLFSMSILLGHASTRMMRLSSMTLKKRVKIQIPKHHSIVRAKFFNVL